MQKKSRWRRWSKWESEAWQRRWSWDPEGIEQLFNGEELSVLCKPLLFTFWNPVILCNSSFDCQLLLSWLLFQQEDEIGAFVYCPPSFRINALMRICILLNFCEAIAEFQWFHFWLILAEFWQHPLSLSLFFWWFFFFFNFSSALFLCWK